MKSNLSSIYKSLGRVGILFLGAVTFISTLLLADPVLADPGKKLYNVIKLLERDFINNREVSGDTVDEIISEVSTMDTKALSNSDYLTSINTLIIRLINNAVNLEVAFEVLAKTGLQEKLISLGDVNEVNTMAWWLNRSPLKSKPLGQGVGKSAMELGIHMISHNTLTIQNMLSITMDPNQINFFESRPNTVGESASFGRGAFGYTVSAEQYNREGYTVWGMIHPQARLGTDFDIHKSGNGFLVKVTNKNALIPMLQFKYLSEKLEAARKQEVVGPASVIVLGWQVKELLRALPLPILASRLPKLIDQLLLLIQNEDIIEPILVSSILEKEIIFSYITKAIHEEVKVFTPSSGVPKMELAGYLSSLPDPVLEARVPAIIDWLKKGIDLQSQIVAMLEREVVIAHQVETIYTEIENHSLTGRVDGLPVLQGLAKLLEEFVIPIPPANIPNTMMELMSSGHLDLSGIHGIIQSNTPGLENSVAVGSPDSSTPPGKCVLEE